MLVPCSKLFPWEEYFYFLCFVQWSNRDKKNTSGTPIELFFRCVRFIWYWSRLSWSRKLGFEQNKTRDKVSHSLYRISFSMQWVSWMFIHWHRKLLMDHRPHTIRGRLMQWLILISPIIKKLISKSHESQFKAFFFSITEPSFYIGRPLALKSIF